MLQPHQSVCKGSDRGAPGEKHKDSSKEPQAGETEGKVTKAMLGEAETEHTALLISSVTLSF